MVQEKKYIKVDSIETFQDMIKHIKSFDLLALDSETTSLNPRKGKIVGISISGEIGVGYYMPTMIFKDKELVDAEIDGVSCHELAKKTLSLLKGKKIIAHNFSFDGRFIKNFYGIDLIQDLYVDTVLLVHTVQEEGAGFGTNSPFGLKSIAKSIQKEIGLDMEFAANEEQVELKASIKNNGGSTTKDLYEIWKADIDILSKYAAADTDLTLRIYHYFIKILKEENLEKFFFEDEVMPLYKEVTIVMEEKGLKLDMNLISKTNSEITQELKKYSELVLSQLISLEDVKLWTILKAQESYPITNKGHFAQKLIEIEYPEFTKSKITGKYHIIKENINLLPDCTIKSFLESGDQTLLDKDTCLKIQLKLWRDDNNGHWFNIQSKDQLGEIVFGALNIPYVSETKKGKPQFDDKMIIILSEKYEWAKNLRIYNKLLKIKSTYIDRFLRGEENGRYYAYYKQHGTVSGRYSSDMQQLPRPKEEDEADEIIVKYNNQIRAFFIADENNIFIDADYESLEPHVFSDVSGDEGLKDIFRNGWDFYSTIAIKTEKLNQYSPDKKAPNFLKKLNPQARTKSKAYALGIPYGQSPFALGKLIKVSTKEAVKLVNGYLYGYPELKKWMENTNKYIKENGYIKTKVGRIKHSPKIKEIYEKLGDSILDYNIRKQLSYEFGEDQINKIYRDYKNGINNAYNYQIQSLSASIVNRAAIAINREFKKRGINGWVCAQIHDQIVTEIENDKSEEGLKIVRDCMENTTKISLELKAPPSLTSNFRDGHG